MIVWAITWQCNDLNKVNISLSSHLCPFFYIFLYSREIHFSYLGPVTMSNQHIGLGFGFMGFLQVFFLTQVRVLVECVVFNRLLFLVVCTLFEKGMVFAIFFVWWYFLIFLETSPVYSINKYTVTSTSTWHLYYTWFISLTVTRSPTYIPNRIPLHTTLSYPTCPS